jgi:hypothetical protein
MKIVKLIALAGMILAAGTGVRAQSADEIMEKHVKAIGGEENWNKIKTIKLTGSMSVQGMDLNIIQTVDIGNAMRTDINVMGMSGFTILTPKTGWMYMPFQGGTKIDTMKPDMVKAGQKQLEIKGNQLLDYKTSGDKLEYKGKDSVNNALCYKLKLTDKDGNESVSFFDVATYYLVRTESKVKIDDQEQEIAVGYNNYKKLDGDVVMPMMITTPQGDLTFKTIEINKRLDPSLFIPTLPKDK